MNLLYNETQASGKIKKITVNGLEVVFYKDKKEESTVIKKILSLLGKERARSNCVYLGNPIKLRS